MAGDWHGAQGLADDIRYYGKWMRDEAKKRIGHLYPKVTLPKEYGGGEATVIAWLWARTVKCPNPACGTQMPLVHSFYLSTKKGKEAWVEPNIDYSVTPPVIRFAVKTGKGSPHEGTVNRQGATCIACSTPVPFDHIRNEGKAGKMSAQLMAIVAEGQHGRVYLPPNEEHVTVAAQEKPEWKPEAILPHNPRDFKTPNYGLRTFSDLFSQRQLVALTTFSDLVQEAREMMLVDVAVAGLPLNDISLNDGGAGANAYADAVATYLGLGVSKLADYNCANVTWSQSRDQAGHAFTKQAIPMVWDYTEVNPLAGAAGDLLVSLKGITSVIEKGELISAIGYSCQSDAASEVDRSIIPLISTDPPYYDNVGYADLSDFFYVWLRRSLNTIYPELFKTMLVPKAQELVATPYRFGGSKSKAQEFFETGLGQAFEHMRAIQHPDYPLSVYYAFKQAESESDGNDSDGESSNGKSSKAIASTGWETMLEGLIRSGFTITGTWPVRTERASRSVSLGTNALASSIVLVCRPRPIDAPVASRREFLNALRAELPSALKNLQHGSIAPVDLAQASIGPGMSIYSRYSKVVESDGTPLSVRTALQLINRALDEVLEEQEGEYDAETRWAIAWFEQYAQDAGDYGIAETLSKAKNMSVENLEHAGLVVSKAGKVRLRRRDELSEEWHLKMNLRLTVWEVMQRLIFALEQKGESGAGDILRQASSQGEIARDLAYRLYTLCERKGWAQEALAYNSLVASWSEISRLANREASDSGLWEATYLG
jgi:putative DNA methylase